MASVSLNPNSIRPSAHRERSTRIFTSAGRESSYVRYSESHQAPHDAARSNSAVLADISASGARLISKRPMSGKVGDLINVELSLAGSSRRVTGQAVIVRQSNEFVFAVRFIGIGGIGDIGENHADQNLKDAIERAIDDHERYLQTSVGDFKRIYAWLNDRKEGVILSVGGLLAALVVGTIVFSFSDSQGERLRPWGKEIPKQWYWDYVNGFKK